MKNILAAYFIVFVTGSLFFTSCGEKNAADQTAQNEKPKTRFGGFESQEKYGEHLVTICGCNDCHTPKKMVPHGMELDSSRLLSGHPSEMPSPNVNRKDMESKGVICTNDLTAWTGPWGTSYTANLTPDPTGIGGWDESNFMIAIKLGKYKGMESSRGLLPPMPWEFLRYMTDEELKAIFAYLKSIKPVKNMVPAPEPPALVKK